MASPFVSARPLQAAKLAAASAVVVLGLGAWAGVFGSMLSVLLLGPFVGVALGAVIVAETVHALYRLATADASAARRLTQRPWYAAVRLVEAVAAVAAAGGVVYTLATLPDDIAGPGAIGLALIMTGASAAVVLAALVRGVLELYVHRTARSGGPTTEGW